MSDSIISVENISKSYVVGHQSAQRESYTALRDVMARGAREFVRKAADMARGRQVVQGDEVEEFWALKDVSFEVKQGEVLGIIGRNGAGKSTLLKILSRITEPTQGRIVLRGRVASLLEVGTGFHPELSGRENIFLNGAILGMTQREIRKKFDEIVAFAEVDRFLDTPVKRYSSGMYVRLAFAVAAHLEPEILIVDEVLAVGDAEFQKKCLGKMSEVAGGGRTVLFVSHNMAAVRNLCNRAILMGRGRVTEDCDAATAVSAYLKSDTVQVHQKDLNLKAPHHPFVLRSVEVVNDAGELTGTCRNDEPIRVRITYDVTSPMPRFRVGFRLHAYDTTVVLTTTDADGLGGSLRARDVGTYCSEVELPVNLLNSGSYYISVGVDIPMMAVVLMADQVADFSVEVVSGMLGDINDKRLGIIAPLLKWQVRTQMDAVLEAKEEIA